MKILMLSDINSSHTQKWVRALAERNVSVCLFGLTSYDHSVFKGYPNIQIKSFGLRKDDVNTYGRDIRKIFMYIGSLLKIKKILHDFQPDIVHAHFATSYGFLGTLTFFHPLIISMWGYDVIDFPEKSVLHRALVRLNFKAADCLLSTSRFMAGVAKKYTRKAIRVTPFGIDTEIFKPRTVKSLFDKDDIVIGTIKTLDEKYGIEYLIRAFHLLRAKYSCLPLKLLIVGGGPQEEYLIGLSKELETYEHTVFTGNISYDNVPEYYNMLTVYAALSTRNSESFGVAVLEASASGLPVVVSSVGGLPEVVQDNITGFVVPPWDHFAAAAAIEKLILDVELRNLFGNNGRENVEIHYNWQNNVDDMLGIYQEISSGGR